MIWGSFAPVDIASVCFLSQWQQWMKIALAETHPEESQIKHHYSPGKYCEEISSPATAEEMRDEALFPGVLWSTLNQALLQENGGWRGGRQLLQPPPRSHPVNVWTHQKHAKCIQMCNTQEPTCRTNRHPLAELSSRPHAYINALGGGLQSVKCPKSLFASHTERATEIGGH